MSQTWKFFLIKVGAWIGVALLVQFCTAVLLGGPVDYVVPGILGLGALHIGLLERTALPGSGGPLLKRGLAILMITFAVWLGTGEEEGLAWQIYSEEVVVAARQSGRPVMIDFTSRRCPPCLEMKRKVFSHGRVKAAAREFIVLRADCTEETAAVRALTEKYGIEAFPTVVFLGTDGQERVNLRLVGFEDALRFRERVESAR